jgi:hypothetical protein
MLQPPFVAWRTGKVLLVPGLAADVRLEAKVNERIETVGGQQQGCRCGAS